MARVLAPLVEFFWAGVAALLIASAALVAIARLALPEVSSQRDALAAWFSASVGRPVNVGHIEASWSGWVPHISVTDISVLDASGRSEIIRFERATLNIAPLDSLGTRTLKPHNLIVAGVTLTLVRDRDGRLSVAGMPPTESPVLEWLIEQDNFAMTEANLTVIDEQAQASFALANLTVTVRNRRGQKHLAGFGTLPPAFGRRLAFELTADRNPLDGAWAGRFDVLLDGLRSKYVEQRLAWTGDPLPDAELDLRAWTRWQDGRLDHAQFELAAAEGKLNPARRLLAAHGRLARRAQGWRLDVADLDLPALGPAAARPAAFSVAWDTSGDLLERVALRAVDVPVVALAGLTTGLAALRPEHRDSLTTAAPEGMLTSLDALWRNPSQALSAFYVDARVQRLSARPTMGVPAFDGLSFRVRGNAGGGLLEFADAEARVVDEAHLVTPLTFEKLDGVVGWSWSATGGLDLQSPRLQTTLNGSGLRVMGQLDNVLDAARVADIQVQMPHASGQRLHELLPLGVLPPRGEAWARAVIEAGTVSGGRMLLRGPLADYPFDADEGQFEVDFEITDATLRYARNWPRANALDGHVAIRGRTATMAVARGKVLDADLVDVHIELPDLHVRERAVHITGRARGPAQSATDIIMASPLKAGKAARLQELDIGDAIEVTLDMNLALYPGGPREVLGQARFAGNRIFARGHGILLEDVHGTVSFTRGDWYGEGLRASFDGAPVDLILNGGLDDPNYDSEFRMTGTAPASKLIDYLGRYTPTIHQWLERNQRIAALSGDLPWKAVLTIPVADPDGRSLPQRLSLESSLHGLGIDLPWPFGKVSGARKPLRIELALRNGLAEHTRVDFGDLLDAEIDVVQTPDGRRAITRVEVLFGALEAQFEGEPGISLRGNIQELPLGEWLRLLGSADGAAATAGTELPLVFDVEVNRLDFGGRHFKDLHLQGQRETALWRLAVDGDAIAGTATAPRDFARSTLEVDLEHLHLPRRNPDPGTGGANTLDPRRFPALDIRISRFHFADIALGETRIGTSRHAQGQRLDRLSFQDDGFDLTATGEWLHDSDSGQHSHFEIDVHSGKLADLLGRFGYSVANIDGGQTRIELDARWAGTPTDFALAAMNGSFELHVASGRIVDVDPGGGRLFGLLSLQALPRRLSLDFDDLFRKGFAFDSIEGAFEIDNGNAYTNSLLMSGPSARIDVSGRTGLETKDYDQRVVVTPTLSDTLPLAGALFGPIGAGAGAVFFLGQKLFKGIPDQIDRILSREYVVTGTWDDPSIEKI